MTQRRSPRSGIEDRWLKSDDKSPTARNGQGLRWMARYVGTDGKERSKSFGKKTDAAKWLTDTLTDIRAGRWVDPAKGVVTFASFYSGWAANRRWGPGTRRARDLAANSVTFGDSPLVDIRFSDIEAWVTSMVDSGLAASTIKERYKNVSGVLAGAVRDERLTKNPCPNMKDARDSLLPRVANADITASAVPEPEEVGAILEVATGEMYALLAVAAFAGVRAGEVAGLQVGDVAFLKRELRIRRQAQREGGRLVIRAPKFDKERDIPVPDELLAILARHIEVHCPGTDPARWLFPSSSDTSEPVSANAVGHRWRKVLEKSGQNADLHMHQLRHYYASGLIEDGRDVVAVSRAMGHASPAITLQVYSHLFRTGDDSLRSSGSRLMNRTLGEDAADSLRTVD